MTKTKTPCRTKTKTPCRTKSKTPCRTKTKTKTKTPRAEPRPRRNTGLKTRYRKQFNIFFYAPALISLPFDVDTTTRFSGRSGKGVRVFHPLFV
jgi:hypothetical protein